MAKSHRYGGMEVNKQLTKMFRQHKTNRAYGNFMQIVQQLGLFVAVINLCLLIITASSVLQLRGYEVPVWLLGLLAACVLGIAGSMVFAFGLPSYFSAFNKQFYRHDNLLRKDIEKILDHLGLEKSSDED